MKKCSRDIDNYQGFLILRVKRRELEDATYQEHCVCDNCLASPEEGYYVAVLNRWLCAKCYAAWKEYAVRYSEDIPIEEKNYLIYRELLNYK